MTRLTSEVLRALEGKTLATAESCTGGGIGAAITAIPGSSKVYKGGVVSYTNEVKAQLLGVDREVLDEFGAVSAQTAKAMAQGVRRLLNTDVAVSVTGLAGPDGDDGGNPVGTVYIGYSDICNEYAKVFCFLGNREEVRTQAVRAALEIILAAQ